MSLGLFVALVVFGLFTGAFAGLLGVGGGIFMVPFLVLAVVVDQHIAQATSLLVVLPTSAVASWTLHRKGVGALGVALAMGALGAGGAVLGALLALALSGATLKALFGALLVLTGARLALRTLRSPSPADGSTPGA